MGLQQAALPLDEETAPSKPKRKYAGKNYAGIERNQHNRMSGIKYETTPILFELPIVGKRVRILERVIAPPEECKNHRVRYVEERPYSDYEVRGYTQGIENPLQNNNFLMTAYRTKSGKILSQSFRTIDIALGIIKVIEVDEDEENISTAEINNSQTGNLVSIVTGR